MYCTECGKQIDDKAKFCPECGAKILKEAAAEETEIKAEKTAAEEIVAEPVEEVKEETKAAPDIEDAEVKAAPEDKATAAETAEKSTSDTVKEKLEGAADSAKEAAKGFASSEAVQSAKKEMDNIFQEAKAASAQQSGKAGAGETVTPREEVSFLVDWLYWSGRRGRMKYLLIAILLSICSISVGSYYWLNLFICYASFVNLVKRFHDCDKSGFCAFLLLLAESVILGLTLIFGIIGIGVAATGTLSGLLLWLVPLMIVWAIKLWIFFWPGTPGPNKYGPEPK